MAERIPFIGTFAAPDATVRLAVGATSHSGAFFAKNLQLDPDVKVTAVPFAGWSGFPFDIVPRFECVQTAPNGTKIATFGYFNPNPAIATIPIGASNKFSITPDDRRQPTTFLLGAHSSNFSIGYTGTAPSWTLGSTTATIDSTKLCNNTFEVPAANDATLSSAAPSANFGTGTTLEVSPQKVAVVKFDRKDVLAARGAGRFIKSARLELSLSSGSSALDAYPMRQEWKETTATWTCGNDQDASATNAWCYAVDSWAVPRRTRTYDNPYDPDAIAQGAPATGKIVFDVTNDLQRFLSSGTAVSWMIQPRSGGSTILFSREGGKPAKLVIDGVPYADVDFASEAPFSFQVDTSLATSDTLPPFANALTRPLATLKTSDGTSLQFAENELLVVTDSPAELSAIQARWNAVEVAAPDVNIPGAPKSHVLRIDTSRGDPATLVPNIHEVANQPFGIQKVSSTAGLGLLAAMADEQARGNMVAVNWLVPPAAVNIDGFNQSHFTDGTPANQGDVETSSNSFDWANFQLHDVNEAWKLLFFTGRLKPVVNVGIIDAGFDANFLDIDDVNLAYCPGGSCSNPFKCNGTDPCPWHGIGVVSAGFGRVNNNYGGAGPGAGVTNLQLWFGFGDMATTLITVPSLLSGGVRIVNFSNAIPLQNWLALSAGPAEQIMWLARHVGQSLIFAASGNKGTDVDAKDCYNLLITTVCPHEHEEWFPCEGWGVNCVGATGYADKVRLPTSNYGDSVRYWATGVILAPADPDRGADGPAYHSSNGTSYSSPFMAGTAALAWAANGYKTAGDIETCLDVARVGGENGRYVNAYFSTACAMGSPSNLAPLVEIVNPGEEDNNYSSLGILSLDAKAADFEDGPISSILWTSDVDGLLGTSTVGQPLLWSPPSPGVRVITAKAFDSTNKEGSDTATLSFTPAAPNLKILLPAVDGDNVPLGLPVDFIGVMTNFTTPGQNPPYGSASWVPQASGAVSFNSLSGASVQGTFSQAGTASVTWNMTVDGQTGTTTRSFNVFDDGKLHVKITSPLKNNEPVAGKFKVSLDLNTLVQLNAVSNRDSIGGVGYHWTVDRLTFTGVSTTVLTSTSQATTFTPAGTGYGCGNTRVKISVAAFDPKGEMASDSIDGTVFKFCPPP